MNQKAIQDYYPDKVSHCFGCGRLNKNGLHLKSYWDGNESVCKFMPEEFHVAVPGIVSGGLIATVIDCHSIATAFAAVYQVEGRSMDKDAEHPFLYVAASLKVDYLNPAPIGKLLEFRSKVTEIRKSKVIISTSVLADQTPCANGQVVAVRVPMSLLNICESH